jgi:hypothetical protein
MEQEQRQNGQAIGVSEPDPLGAEIVAHMPAGMSVNTLPCWSVALVLAQSSMPAMVLLDMERPPAHDPARCLVRGTADTASAAVMRKFVASAQNVTPRHT